MAALSHTISAISVGRWSVTKLWFLHVFDTSSDSLFSLIIKLMKIVSYCLFVNLFHLIKMVELLSGGVDLHYHIVFRPG